MNIMIRRRVDLGEINLRPKIKSKTINYNNNLISATKLEGKTQFYSKFFKSKKKALEEAVLHLSPEARKINKNYPVFSKFIEEHLVKNFSKRSISFSNNNVDILLNPIKVKFGQNHKEVYKLKVDFKKENISKDYFVKISDDLFPSSEEFVASKIFERFGLNTIKPHMAYFNPGKSSVIIYDFSNLLTLKEAVFTKKISVEEEKIINNKIMSLYEYQDKIKLGSDSRNGIADFYKEDNVFIKKTSEGIKVYFTDLFIG